MTIRQHAPEATALFVALGVVGFFAHVGALRPEQALPLALLAFPLVAWIAVRLGPLAATLAILVSAAAITWGVATGSSPVVADSLLWTALGAGGLMGTLAVTGLLVAATEERRRVAEEEGHQFQAHLETALAGTLTGVLPICSHCKDIRTEANAWLPVEQYLTARTPARFSHGLCPKCRDRHYPGVGRETAGKPSASRVG